MAVSQGIDKAALTSKRKFVQRRKFNKLFAPPKGLLFIFLLRLSCRLLIFFDPPVRHAHSFFLPMGLILSFDILIFNTDGWTCMLLDCWPLADVTLPALEVVGAKFVSFYGKNQEETKKEEASAAAASISAVSSSSSSSSSSTSASSGASRDIISVLRMFEAKDSGAAAVTSSTSSSSFFSLSQLTSPSALTRTAQSVSHSSGSNISRGSTGTGLPLCSGHNRPCVLRVARKPGPDMNRSFYACGVSAAAGAVGAGAGGSGEESSCIFRVWKDEWDAKHGNNKNEKEESDSTEEVVKKHRTA